MTVDEPRTLRHLWRELPRKRIALVFLLVVANLALVIRARAHEIAGDRKQWTADEWRETVWRWK